MKLSLVVAMDRNGLIGKGGGLPWPRIPADMRHFRRLTHGEAVIVGRKTRYCIGHLPDRINIILSRDTPWGDDLPSWIKVATTPDIAITMAKRYGKTFIIGGAQTYAAFEPHVAEAHVTVIDGEFDGDTYFPFRLFDAPEWEPIAAPVELAAGVVYHKLGRV